MARPKIQRRKVKTSITIDPELFNWVQSKIETKEFSNFTHAVERGLLILKKELEEK
jgi:Arc/MetJ-type ribon-helix-helix transcriptional regulator